jgi:BlaI family transcriptional regulator, penicillinase repressor
MARPVHPGPTPRELLLLKLLWQHGPSTIRQLREYFPRLPRPAHTSLQTNLQGMYDKGYVSRQAEQAGHVYAAAVTQTQVESSVLSDLIGRVFDGSALRLITAAISQGGASAEEIQQLQALLDAHTQDRSRDR